MSHTSLSVTRETKARFDQLKRDDETVDAAVNRALDALERQLDESDSATETDELLARLDEMAETLPVKTAAELENRMTRR